MTRWTLFLLMLPGCSLFGRKDEDDPCDEQIMVLGLDEASPAGFSGQDLLDNLPGPGRARWSGPATVPRTSRSARPTATARCATSRAP